jgi:hypothetical protein
VGGNSGESISTSPRRVTYHDRNPFSAEVVMRMVLWLVLAFLVGCAARDSGGSNVPMPTDGPNQVVIKVPGMT